MLLLASGMGGRIVAQGKNLIAIKSLDEKKKENKNIDRIEKLLCAILTPFGLLEKLPKAYFTHFYVVGTIVSGAVLYRIHQIFKSINSSGSRLLDSDWHHGDIDLTPIILAEILTTLQILRRLLESVFVTRTTKYSKMLVLQYLVGLAYYVFTPLAPLVENYFRLLEKGSLGMLD